MLKIQVLGRGLIPRGYGLAPRKTPFFADLMMIETILHTNGLQVVMIHPEDGHGVRVTTQNVRKLWNAYSDKYKSDVRAGKTKAPAVSKVTTPTKTETPAQPVQSFQNTAQQQPQKPAETTPPKKEEATAPANVTTTAPETAASGEKKDIEETAKGSDEQKSTGDNSHGKKDNQDKPTTFKPMTNPNNK